MLENLKLDLFVATAAQAAAPAVRPADASRETAAVASLLARAEARLRSLDAAHPHPDNAAMLRRLNDLLDELQERTAAAH